MKLEMAKLLFILLFRSSSGKAKPNRVLLMFLERAPKLEGLTALEEIAKGSTDVFKHLG